MTRIHSGRVRIISLLTAVALGLGAAVTALAADLESVRRFDIKPQRLETALIEFSMQADLQVIGATDTVSDAKTDGVSGERTSRDALGALLKGLPLGFDAVGTHSVRIVSSRARASSQAGRQAPIRFAQSQIGARAGGDPGVVEEDGERPPSRLEEVRVTVPEVLVTGSKILNMDIPRSRDDAQPYVIFDRETLERSAAVDLTDFLKQRLPMNASAQSYNQAATAFGNTSTVNLRGLGTNQTLILIDGHRISNGSNFSSPTQPDLNGIPLSAVERIEVLPTTASGIYGGRATGGVLNVVLRRDYRGAELKLGYENTFEANSAIRRMELASGFSLEEGKTTVLLAATWSDNAGLLVEDRHLVQRGRDTIFHNNPSFFRGAPPLGATTNVRSTNGSPLFGAGTSNITSVPAGYQGGAGLAPLQANAGGYNIDLADSAQANGGSHLGMLNAARIKSAMTTVRRRFGERFQAFLDLSATENEGNFVTAPATGTFTINPSAPNNPFGQAVTVNVPLSGADRISERTNKTGRAVAGVIVQLPRDWKAEADYTWSRSKFALPAEPIFGPALAAAIGNGTLDVLRDPGAGFDVSSYLVEPNTANTPARSTLRNVALRVSGAVGELPGGQPTLSALVEHNDQQYGETFRFVSPTRTTYAPSRSQSVKSVYLEAKVPLVSARNGYAGLRELELQLAGRWDDYETNGSSGGDAGGATLPVTRSRNRIESTNPTIGVRYRPAADVMLRASYGTGFLPPEVTQLTPSGSPFTSVAVDPRRGNTSTGSINALSGGSPTLQPEESESWSGGVVFTPRFTPGLRISVDYTRIHKTDNITVFDVQGVLNNEAYLPGRVTRGGTLPDDPAGWAGPVTFVDTSFVNAAAARIESYDLAVDYLKNTERFGSFDVFAAATWTTRFETQVVASAPWIDEVGIAYSNPLELRANAGVNWTFGAWALGWTTRFFDSYLVADPGAASNATTLLNQGNGGRVASQIYHDLSAGYGFPTRSSSLAGDLLSGIEVQAGIKNVFNKRPPFDAGNFQFYYYSYFGDPRLAAYYLTLKKVF